jgi:predicted HicB family RNase H-like nuclease
MANKKVSFGAKPKSSKSPKDADTWVNQADRDDSSKSMKRLTIDIPKELHKRLKIAAASWNKGMADLVREWIRQGLEKI